MESVTRVIPRKPARVFSFSPRKPGQGVDGINSSTLTARHDLRGRDMLSQCASGGKESSMCKHFVRFYEDAYPADEASDFIAAGLLAGDACIVILNKPLREAVEQRLNARGISTGPEGSCLGSFSAIDTHEALSQLMVDGRLDKERAAETLGFVLSQAAQGGSRRVRLVGDPAPALYAAGNQQDAIALERLVDHLATVHSASVFCAYPIQGFCREGSTNSLFRICAQHSALEFPKGLWVYGYLESAATHRPDLGLVH